MLAAGTAGRARSLRIAPVVGKMRTKGRRAETDLNASGLIVSPRGPRSLPSASWIQTSPATLSACLVSTARSRPSLTRHDDTRIMASGQRLILEEVAVRWAEASAIQRGKVPPG
jgi:hypothetical protein